MLEAKECPSCKTPWEEDITIYQHFLNQGYSKEEAQETAEFYGCTKEKPRNFGKDVAGIEIQGKYDGVSYWECQKCKDVFDRWTMKKVEKGLE